jgi:hypothetical protein
MLVVLVSLLLNGTHAQTAPPVTTAPAVGTTTAPTAVATPAAAPAAACADIHEQLAEAVRRVQSYQQMERAMHQALGAYTTDISSLINRWHDDLKQKMEGKTVKIPANYFNFMTAGSQQITEATGWVFQNSDILLSHIDKLVTLLNNCYSATTPAKTNNGQR